MKHCCSYPFTRVTIEINGNVSFCCPAYTDDYFIGNIFEKSFEDIWYGKKAQEFRKSILDGSYKYCNLDICGEFDGDWWFDLDTFPDKKLLSHPPFPEIICLNYSRSCNVRCKTCRDELYVENNEDTEKFDAIINKIAYVCKDARYVYLNGGGELFTSPHFKKLTNLLVKINPALEFCIHSNGLLFDEKHLKDFGLENNLRYASISIHAATKRTYSKIVRGGHWKQLQKNLKYISQLKKQNRIRGISFIFVLHSLNYKEMPAFVKMANKFGAVALFWRFRNWDSTEMCKNYEKYTCWDPKHKDYKKFLRVLNKLKKMGGYRFDEEYLRKLQAQTKDPWWVRLKDIFVGRK